MKQSNSGYNFLYLSKKRRNASLNLFKYQILTEEIGKAVTR